MQRDKAYVKGIQFAENLELPSNLKYYISIALDTTEMDGCELPKTESKRSLGRTSFICGRRLIEI